MFASSLLDDIALNSSRACGVRSLVACATGVLAIVILGPAVGAGWLAIALACELWRWLATRPHRAGHKPDPSQRLVYLASLLAAAAVWSALGLLAWRTGRQVLQISAVALWVSQLLCAAGFGFRSPAAHVAVSAPPTLAMLAAPFLQARASLAEQAVLLAGLLVCIAYAALTARQTARFRRNLVRTEQSLRESEERYRVLADNITDVIARTGLDGRKRYMSPSVKAVLGLTPEEMMAEPALGRVHPEDGPRLTQAWRALADGQPAATVEYRAVRGDGSAAWIEANLALVRDPLTGAPSEIVSTSRDIGQRKAMEAELTEAARQAEAAASAKSEFVANMSHELRTPLTAVLGFSDLLRKSQRLDAEDRRCVDLIHSASTTLLMVVNDVLDFSRIEAGGVTLEAAPFDLVALVEDAMDLVAARARDKGLAVRVTVEGAPARLAGDAGRLRQVLLNLLGNALKFTGSGAIAAMIRFSAPAQDRAPVRVEIRDTGIGIAPDKLHLLFERFAQVDGSIARRFGGTGLGLAICKQLVELMGGRIGVESREAEGSTFWFELDLPLAAGEAPVAEETDAPVEALGPLRILVAEDHPANRELIRLLLQSFGLEPDLVTNGAEAVEAMRAAPYDLVLMDVQMPVMDGLSATSLIRGLEGPAASAPIIAMTANVLPSQIASYLAVGMDDHVGKPLDANELFDAIARWSDPDAGAARTEARVA